MLSDNFQCSSNHRLLQYIQPLFFLQIHMDRKSSDKDRADVRKLLHGLDNARVLEPAQSVSWGGFSITLTALFGLSTLVEWSRDWDYFVNLRYFGEFRLAGVCCCCFCFCCFVCVPAFAGGGGGAIWQRFEHAGKGDAPGRHGGGGGRTRTLWI